MWPLNSPQYFSKIWPSDLVLDSTWPISNSFEKSPWKNILTNFQEYWTKNVASVACTMFFSKIWPGDLVFFTQHDPFSISSKILLRKRSWSSFRNIGPKMWALERTKGFSKIWPGDLLFVPTWPIFKLICDIIEANLLTVLLSIGLKTWPIQRTQGFSKIWPSDLIFYSTAELHSCRYHTRLEIKGSISRSANILSNYLCGV